MRVLAQYSEWVVVSSQLDAHQILANCENEVFELSKT